MEALDELAARDVKALVVACNTSTAVALRDLRARYDLPVLGVVRPGAAAAALATRNRRVGRDRDARRPSARTRTSTRSRTRTPRSRSTSTRRRASSRWSRPGSCPAPRWRRRSPRSSRRSSGERDGEGEFVFPRPPGAAIDTLLLGCTHYPLLRPVHRGGRRGPGRDRGQRRRRRRRRWPSCCRSTGSRRRARPAARPRTRAPPVTRDPRNAGRAPARSTSSSRPATSSRFTSIASRMFGEAFPDVESVELRADAALGAAG